MEPKRCSGMDCKSSYGCRDERGRCPWPAQKDRFLCSHCETMHSSFLSFLRAMWAAWRRDTKKVAA